MTATDAVDALVVGSGPNGLAAAVTFAQAGLSVTVLEAEDEIGGGTRTCELTVPGVLHDVCSAVHPFGVASPFFASLPLDRHGLEWRWPEINLAHPLDGGRAGVLVRSLQDTAAGLGTDGPAWARTFGPLAARFHDIASEILGLHEPLVNLFSHATCYKFRQALIRGVLACRYEIFCGHSQFAADSEQRRLDHRPHLAGSHQSKPVGHWVQSTAVRDECSRVL